MISDAGVSAVMVIGSSPNVVMSAARVFAAVIADASPSTAHTAASPTDPSAAMSDAASRVVPSDASTATSGPRDTSGPSSAMIWLTTR